MTKRGIKIGDKVKVDAWAVARNGMHESEEQEARFNYLVEHPGEVYTVKRLDACLAAKVVLDHPVLGETSFYEDELIKEDR